MIPTGLGFTGLVGNSLSLTALSAVCAGMAEWLKRRPRDPGRARMASDMTAVGHHALVGSNPTPGAKTPFLDLRHTPQIV